MYVAKKNISDDMIPEMLVIDNPQDIRLIFSRKHNMILKLVTEKELSISDIAKSLNINPGSVHYHIKELEKHGLVKQVRDEIKGGIIKKYYRAAAKRILLEIPNFNQIPTTETFPAEEFTDRIIESIEFLGYHLPSENMEDAKELLQRYDKRINCLLKELHNSGLGEMENDGMVLNNVNQMILIMRSKEDPEMDRIYREFNKLFQKYE